MPIDIENNLRDCQMEKEAREKRLLEYAEAIQKSTREESSQIIKEVVSIPAFSTGAVAQQAGCYSQLHGGDQA